MSNMATAFPVTAKNQLFGGTGSAGEAAPVSIVGATLANGTLTISATGGGAPIDSPVFTTKITLPGWTTGTRPASPAAGTEGFNTTTSRRETYNGTSWATTPLPVVAITYAATITPDFTVSPNQTLTLTGNATMNAPTMQAGGSYQLRIAQDATGGRTITWPAAFKWPGGTPPALSTAANAVDVLTITSFDGTTAVAVLSKDFR